MADTADVESLQAQLARQHEIAVKMQALQRVLQVFAPALLQEAVDYVTLLDRVRTALNEERVTATAPLAATPQASEG